MPENLTACRDCKHYLHQIKNEAAPNVWYNHFCAAHPKPPRFDPVAGASQYGEHDDRYDNVQDHNRDGHCKDYTEKKK